MFFVTRRIKNKKCYQFTTPVRRIKWVSYDATKVENNEG